MFRLAYTLFALLLSYGAAFAAPTLFDGYELGAPKHILAAQPGMDPGQGTVTDDLIRQDVPFAGHNWTMRLNFVENRLAAVTLMSPYDRLRFNDVKRHLEQNHFEILGIVVDEKALDLFRLIKAGGIEAFQKHFLELVRAKAPERVSYEWFDTQTVSLDQKKMANSINEFLRVVDMDIRQAEVTQLGEAASGPQALLVTFSCPVRNAAK